MIYSSEISTGHPEFVPRMYEAHKRLCDLAPKLQEQVNRIFSEGMGEPLRKVARHLAKMTANSFSAVLLLGMNGYGYDAMKIVRNMFEASVTLAYLKRHPEELQDFMDYHWIAEMKRHRYMEEYNQDLLKRIKPETVENAKTKYLAVVDRFRNSKGVVRGTWSNKSIAIMCSEMGMKENYELVYRLASDIHHSGMSGILMQADPNPDVLDVDIAPSEMWVKEALIAAHAALVVALTEYIPLALPELKDLGRELDSDFQAVWKKSPKDPGQEG